MIGDFEGNLRDDSEFAYTHNVARVGTTKGPWALSLFYRYDYYSNFDPDTAELQYRRKNDISIESNRVYRIDIDTIHAESIGFSVSRSFELPRRSLLRARLNLIRGISLMDGAMRGNVNVESDGSLTGDVYIDYFYSEDALFHRPNVDKPKAWGASVDLFFEWDISDVFELRLSAEDLLSRLEWDQAPFTTAKAISRTTRLDENGLLDVQPVLSGLESEDDFTQKLPLRNQFLLDYHPASRWGWQLQIDQIQWQEFYRVNGRYEISEHLDLKFAADFRRQAIGLGGRYRNIEFFLLSDSINLNDARALELRFVFELAL